MAFGDFMDAACDVEEEHHEALPRPHAAMKDYRECVRMKLIQYQALLGNPRNVASVRARIRDVEHVGGHVEIAPPTRVGMVLVMIELPEGYIPEQFFPNIPFYPI